MFERLSDKLREYLEPARGRTVNLRDIRIALNIEPGSKDDQNLRVLMAVNFVRDHTVKPSGLGDGVYKVLEPVLPVEFSLNGEDNEGVLNVCYPRSYIDDTVFGLEDMVELSQGDLVEITGETNYGKTCIALSLLGENLNLFSKNVLMGSEYTSSEGEISPKLRRRLRRMDWAKWIDDKGKPRFKLLPVEHDYEDYVEYNGLTVIDWISLPGEYYLIDRVLKTIKDRVGGGLVVAVLQKNKGAEFAEGGQRAERYADLVLKVDRFGDNESILTIGKVKSAKSKATGRMFAFSIVNHGANLMSIREVVKCEICYGRGYVGSGDNKKRCKTCMGLKYVNKIEV